MANKYERYTIALRYTPRFQLQRELEGGHVGFYQSYDAHKGEIPEEALEIFRAFHWVLGRATGRNFCPVALKVWDYEPAAPEVLAEVAAGRIAATREVGEYPNFREAVEAFLKGEEKEIEGIYNALGLE